MQPEDNLIISGDGSHTLRSEIFNVTYHSTHGAVTESTIIFIQAGLEYFAGTNPEGTIRIFEMGFGTGLNALLTAEWALKHQKKINYTTIEAYPLTPDITGRLNYGNLENGGLLFSHLHACPWGDKYAISPYFDLLKIEGKFEDHQTDRRFDVIYYDAFGPGAQPHLWEVPILRKAYERTASGGVLTSFCVQGAFRRNLKEVGYEVEKLPGPPGKREITRAIRL